MNSCLRIGGIIFILLGLLTIVAGLGLFGSTAEVASEQVAEAEALDNEAEQAGAIIGTGIGAAIMTGVSGGIGILGLILLVVGLIAYFVGNSGRQKDKQLKLQEQELNMLKDEPDSKAKHR